MNDERITTGLFISGLFFPSELFPLIFDHLTLYPHCLLVSSRVSFMWRHFAKEAAKRAAEKGSKKRESLVSCSIKHRDIKVLKWLMQQNLHLPFPPFSSEDYKAAVCAGLDYLKLLPCNKQGYTCYQAMIFCCEIDQLDCAKFLYTMRDHYFDGELGVCLVNFSVKMTRWLVKSGHFAKFITSYLRDFLDIFSEARPNETHWVPESFSLVVKKKDEIDLDKARDILWILLEAYCSEGVRGTYATKKEKEQVAIKVIETGDISLLLYFCGLPRENEVTLDFSLHNHEHLLEFDRDQVLDFLHSRGYYQICDQFKAKIFVYGAYKTFLWAQRKGFLSHDDCLKFFHRLFEYKNQDRYPMFETIWRSFNAKERRLVAETIKKIKGGTSKSNFNVMLAKFSSNTLINSSKKEKRERKGEKEEKEDQSMANYYRSFQALQDISETFDMVTSVTQSLIEELDLEDLDREIAK